MCIVFVTRFTRISQEKMRDFSLSLAFFLQIWYTIGRFFSMIGVNTDGAKYFHQTGGFV